MSRLGLAPLIRKEGQVARRSVTQRRNFLERKRPGQRDLLGRVLINPVREIGSLNVRFSNRPVGVKRFQASLTALSMSLTGSCFSPESAPRPFHHGIRGRGGTIFWSALPSNERQVQADIRSHLIHRPARDI